MLVIFKSLCPKGVGLMQITISGIQQIKADRSHENRILPCRCAVAHCDSLFRRGHRGRLAANPILHRLVLVIPDLSCSHYSVCCALARGAAATIIATLVSLIIWIFITAVDQYEGGAFVAQVTNWLGMKSIIVEETQLNIIAVLCGFLWPVTYFVSLLIATVITKRRPPKYLQ